MTSTDEAALLAAIEAHPQEDTPRLMLADHYDEFGEREKACDQRLAVLLRQAKAEPDADEPRLAYAEVCEGYGRTHRAEFIRVQCDPLIKSESGHDHLDRSCRCQGCVSRGRERDLLPLAWPRGVKWGYYKATARRLDLGEGETPDVSVYFDRGFAYHVSGPADRWFRLGDRLAAEWPLRVVKLTSEPEITTEERADGRIRCRFRGRREMIDITQWTVVLARNHLAVREEVCAALFEKEWPGIAFEIPGGAHRYITDAELRQNLLSFDRGPFLSPGTFAKPRID